MSQEEWSEEAYYAIRTWVKCHRNAKPMTAERIRAWITSQIDLQPPRDERNWGPVFHRAIKEGVLVQRGWGRAKSSHNSPKRTYTAYFFR